MDLSDPQVWKDGAKVVINAPQIVVPLLAAAAVAAWWFRGKIDRSTESGLTKENKALEAHIKFLKDQLADFSEKLGATKKEAEELRSEIQAGAPQQQLIATANSTVSAIDYTLGVAKVARYGPLLTGSDLEDLVKAYGSEQKPELIKPSE